MVTLGLANGARAHTTVRILWEGLVELTVSKKWCGALRYSLMSHVHSEFTRYRDGNYSFVFVASGVPGALPSFQHLKPFDSSVPAVTWYFAHSSTGSHQRNQPVSSLPVVVWLMRRRNGQGNRANIIGFSVHGQIHQVFLMACHFKFILLAQLEVRRLQYLFMRMYSSTA